MLHNLKTSALSKLTLLGAIAILSACSATEKPPMEGVWIDEADSENLLEIKPSGEGYLVRTYEISGRGSELATQEWPARYMDGIMVVEGRLTVAYNPESDKLTIGQKYPYIRDETGESIPFLENQAKKCLEFQNKYKSAKPKKSEKAGTFGTPEYNAYHTEANRHKEVYTAKLPSGCYLPQ